MWGCQDSLIPVLDNGEVDQQIVPSSLDCDAMSSVWMPNFSEQLGGISDMAMPAISGFYGGNITGYQNFNSRFQPKIADFGEECCGFVEEVKPNAYPNAARESWVCLNFIKS